MVTPLKVTPTTRDTVLRHAVDLLARGGVAVIPTDTVYGLAAHPACAASVARLGTIKGRPTGKPIALLAADAVRRAGALFPPAAARLAARFWSGALTLVLDCGGASEGFRVPDHPFCRSVPHASAVQYSAFNSRCSTFSEGEDLPSRIQRRRLLEAVSPRSD